MRKSRKPTYGQPGARGVICTSLARSNTHISLCANFSQWRLFHFCAPQAFKFSLFTQELLNNWGISVRTLKEMRNEVKIMWAWRCFNYRRYESWLNIYSSSYLVIVSLYVISIIYQGTETNQPGREIKEWKNERQNRKITSRHRSYR